MSKGDSTEQTGGGRWGRFPYKPEDLKEEYGTNESGARLTVICPGCGNGWYPVATCCVRNGNRTASPFCQYCGVDFRADPEDVDELRRLKVSARDDESGEPVRELVERCEGLVLDGESTFFREDEKAREECSVHTGGEPGDV